MKISRRMGAFRSGRLRRRTSSLLAVAAMVVTAAALLPAVSAVAVPGSSAPVFDLPAAGGGYSLLDGPESQNGAIAAVDLAGTWTLTPANGSVDDSVQGTGSGQFNYVGAGWGHVGVGGEGAPANPYQGSNSFDLTAGDYATIAFTGTQVTYYAITCPSCGIAAVSVDGGPETLVDLYSPSRAGDVAVWTSPALPDSAHTLKIRVTGTHNPASSSDYVTVDRIEAAVSPTTIAVPGGGWYKQGYTGLAEATYSRQITIPDTGRPQVDKITFGAVNHQATLYVDGTKVGTNTTSFTPSTFDLTPYVQPGHTYTISVDVKGRRALINPANGRYVVPEAAAWSEAVPQGIFRSAFLRVYPQVYIADTAVQTSVTNRTLSYDTSVTERTLRYDTSITNAGNSSQTVTLTGHLSSWNHTGWDYPDIAGRRVTVPAHTTRAVTVTVPWTLGTGSYWWPNVPYRPGYQAQLHLLNLAVEGAAGLHDTATYRFGFRQVEQKDPYYYLNGIRLNVRGDDLAGANYDRVDHFGKGDAYDTLPGFLPPTNANPGWPQVVDNYQRLNYNVVRIHQEPATPYMLDVADQMGLMLIDETAIRGSDGAEDFVAGHDNMVAHARDLTLRDRNHPSVVRWSEANEPGGASEQFIQDLYDTIMAVDPTRPISVDGFFPESYPDMKQPNFNALPHYLGGLGQYDDVVLPQDNRPFGQGEFIWPNCNTPQGFTWFATSTASMRAKDASDSRPYTLLCAWASFVPGVTTDFLTDNNSPPLYGADNLPDPWTNPQIQRLQAAFNPVLVADSGYWDATHLSDINGDWPAPHHSVEPTSIPPQPAHDLPTLTYGSTVTRTLNVFNDTFAGTQINVAWQTRLGSATGPVTASGTLPLTVPLGSHVSPQISFTTPTTGSKLYVILTDSKPGEGTLFRDTSEYFNLAAGQPAPGYTVDDAEQDPGIDQFSYTGDGWTHSARVTGLPPSLPYQHTMSSDNTTGDTASMTFTGTQLRLYGVTGPDGGQATISLDGQATDTIDFYNPTRTGDALLWTSPALPTGNHAFTLRVTGTSNPAATGHQITVDAVDVTGPTPPPPPVSSVDDSVQGTGTDQFNYVGAGWGHVPVGTEGAPAFPYQGSNSYDATAGDYATITFTGTQITYYAVTDTSCGIAEVSIDGGPETPVDLYSTSRAGDTPVFTSPTLPTGTHTLKIRVTDTKNPASSFNWITIDRVKITTPST